MSCALGFGGIVGFKGIMRSPSFSKCGQSFLMVSTCRSDPLCSRRVEPCVFCSLGFGVAILF